jgi:short-subunit dehydrogenase involved in D-alanine esterification of teichoic acids
MSIKQTVLIIGHTSGIGEGLARAIHAQGKRVIATGSRQARLTALAQELLGLETACFDFSGIASLPSNISALTAKCPDIDTVIVSAAIQTLCNFADSTAPSPEAIAKEVATNVTAPMVPCQTLVPFLLNSKKECSIILISSGFAYVPVHYLPIYCPTKAALHYFSVALRAQLAGTNVSVTSLTPGYIDTELDKEFKERLIEMRGGPENAIHPVPLGEFLADVMRELDGLVDGKAKGEIAVGHFPEMVQGKWREAFEPALKMFGVQG